MNEYIYFELEYYQTKIFMQNFQTKNDSHYEINSNKDENSLLNFNNMKFFTNLLRYTLELKFDLKNSLLNEIEWNKIISPTTFVTNYDVYNNLFVLIILNLDCEISFKKNINIFLKKDAIYLFKNIIEPSFVITPLNTNLNKKLYYILYRSTNY